jgi:chromosomal replication initiation ATPase DnaA/DNA-binding SARP family transcriptional activator
MKSVYPQNLIKRVLRQLEPLDVLESLDYRPESLVRDRHKVRMLCPIHGGVEDRTLTVTLDKRHYECSHPGCPGNAGGDLIDLVARTRRLHYDSALRHLVDEFQLSVALPQNQAALNAALVEAENCLELARTDPEQRDEHLRVARERLDQVLDGDSANVQALQLTIRLLTESGNRDDIPQWVLLLADAEEKAGNPEGVEKALRRELDRHGDNLLVRRRLADWYRANARTDEALQEYLVLAEFAESQGDLGQAIQAYRRIQSLGDVGFDAGAMLAQLLLATENHKEAAAELLQQAYRCREAGNLDEAAAALETARELEPEDIGLAQRLLDLYATRPEHADWRDRALALIALLEHRHAFAPAIEALETLVRTQPADRHLLRQLAELLDRANEKVRAEHVRHRLAEACLAADDLSTARAILHQRLDVNPDDRTALDACVRLAERDGNPVEAADALRRLAQAHEKAGDFDAAADVLLRLMPLMPGDLEVPMAVARLRHARGRTPEAIELLVELLRGLAPGEDPEGTLRHAAQCLALLPDQPDLLLERGRLLDRLDRLADADADRLRACQLLLAAGRAAEAERHVAHLLDRHPPPPGAFETMADAMAAQGRQRPAAELLAEHAATLAGLGAVAHAADLLHKALALDPANLTILRRLADALRLLDAPADQRLEIAERLLDAYDRQGDPVAAIRQAHEILDIRPDHVGARRKLLQLYEKTGDTTNWSQSSRQLADLYRDAGDRVAERQLLEGVLARRPTDLDSHERLLPLLFDESEPEVCRRALDRYLHATGEAQLIERAAGFLEGLTQQHPDNAVLKQTLAEVFEKLSRTEEQIAQLLSLLALHEERHEFGAAARIYPGLLALQPDDIEYRNDFIRVLLRAGDRAGAARESVALATLLYRENKREAARRRYEEAVELDRTNADAYRGLARLAFAEGFRSEATAALCRLAETLADEGRLAEADAVLDEALSWAPEDTTLHRRKIALYRNPKAPQPRKALAALDTLARLHRAAGELDESLAVRREAIELFPADPAVRQACIDDLVAQGRHADAVDCLLELATSHRRHRHVAEALELCEQCLAIDPTHLGALSLRAELFEESGDPERALAEWRALAPRVQRIAAVAESSDTVVRVPLRLVPEYTFDRFVVGDQNRFAWATAMAVAKAPGKTPHNPLFLTSDVGLGKTHIAHAIAHHVRQTQPDALVLYASAEDFVSELVDAIQANAAADFRRRYRRADLLLLDDVHLLAGKTRAQEEFFQIFNTLIQERKQIVVTSDRPPQEMAHLEKRLVSRFGAGVIVDIQRPDYETRLAILRRQALPTGYAILPEGLLETIAEIAEGSVRELMAAYKQLMAMCDHGGRELTPETARQAVARVCSAGPLGTPTA